MASVIKRIKRTLEMKEPGWRKKRRKRQHALLHPKPRMGCQECGK